jgi:GNAT superfamily N-acetyltransferase
MLRPATSEDANAVAEVLMQSRSLFVPYAPIAHSESDIRSWVGTSLIPSGGVVIWEVEDQVVAFIAISEDDSKSWINQLYVLPGWEGKGIGHRLLQHAQHVLPKPIHLYTFQQNMNARRFYENHGYKATKFSDGSNNEENCPDILYVLSEHKTEA